LKLIVGLLVSVAIVIAIHYGTDGSNSAEGAAEQTTGIVVPDSNK
jgi:hypothetical protein